MTERSSTLQRVVLPEPLLRAALGRFLREPAQVLLHPAGLNVTEDCCEWLVRGQANVGDAPVGPAVLLTAQPAIQPLLSSAPVALVHLPRRGRPRVRMADGDGALDRGVLRIMAPGLAETQAGALTHSQALPVSERFSRVAGALGDPLWQRLLALRFALVGCGRTGSLLATTLIRMGVRDLALIDPDTVEASTLDGAGYFLPQLGSPKAETLGNYLRVVSPGVTVTPCANSVTSLAALAAVKRADLLVCAADNDGARWACGLLSARYLKVLLDVGVGVFSPLSSPATDGPSMGAEVRLIVPGSEAGPCLACFGGVANPQQVAALFRSAGDERRSQEERVWRQERAGSLRFLAEMAGGHGLALLFGFLSGRVAGSTWLRVEFDADGLPAVHRVSPQRRADCPLCATLGQGDAA
ncbi:MAG: hypothetical protein COZ06_16800 [Armatimonadetes bacterium CG_4_10_14_3_um_filter_66_18]|nr:MAG: hypothetical protein COZ06_16800 [Armatimonadetes bacterium CG_4_10_14_3_um_filter_66_18]